MREVDASLENMKNQHKQRMDACEERRLQFELKQAKMREQVLRFEKFIQENDAKRQRAENKAKQERKLYEDKVKEIRQKTEKIKELEKEQQILNEELGTHTLRSISSTLKFRIVILVSCVIHDAIARP